MIAPLHFALGVGLIVSTVQCLDYNLGLFENFDVGRQIFIDELKLIDHVRKMKASLTENSKLLHKCSIEHNSCDVKTLEDTFQELRKAKNLTASAASSFAFEGDLSGAQKGLLILMDTYGLSAEDLVRGEIQGRYQSPQGLVAEDIGDMAVLALSMGWIDNTIDLLKYINEKFYQGVTDPKGFKDIMSKARKLNNDYLTKRKYPVGQGYKVLPYLVNDRLERKKKQPGFVKKLDVTVRNSEDPYFGSGDAKEKRFRQICNDEIVGGNVTAQGPFKCHYLHHDNAYLRLGPFKVEVLLDSPYRMIFHDILSENEIEFLIDYSTPRLSRKRGTSPHNAGLTLEKLKEGFTRTIHKTVQCWISERDFHEEAQFDNDLNLLPLEDPYGLTVTKPTMDKLRKKIGLATHMNLEPRFSSTDFQVTNYGLGGLCETHVDPHGYIEGRKVQWHQRTLTQSGDILGTFMAWLNDVEAGGTTAYDDEGNEQNVRPTRGSAAFWFSLDKKNHRDARSSHGGCPVLIGSKWILNKWIYSHDQFLNWPCGLTKDGFYRGYTAFH